MIKNSNQKPPVQAAPFAHGVIRQRNNALTTQGFDLGDICLILAQNDQGAWWIKGANNKGKILDTFFALKNVVKVEFTWKTGPSEVWKEKIVKMDLFQI